MTENCSDKPSCSHFEALIHKRLDGDITPGEDRELAAHLAECPGCREELASFEAVRSLLKESLSEPVEVPEGLFESLSERLEEVKPARGLAALLAHPFFISHRGPAFAMASLIMVAALTFGVGRGMVDRLDGSAADGFGPTADQALIQMNSGDVIVLSGDDGDPGRYAAALDDLERAYREALEDDSEAEGYIYTSWDGGESASAIE